MKTEMDIPLAKRLLGTMLLLLILTAGCAHDPNRTSLPQPPPAQPAPAVAEPKTLAPNPPGTAVNPKIEAVGVNEDSAARKTGREEKQDLSDYKEEDDVGPAGQGVPAKKDGQEENVLVAPVPDPLESFNRAMFTFNDRLYFWVMKPVARGYNVIAPEGFRVGIQNFFSNLYFPIRFVNCLLQADLKCTGTELGRFAVNTTMGIGGFFDPASLPEINLKKQDVDFGQTLGVYGIGHGFFIMWPVLGPSSPRDSVGFVGEYFLYPVSYLEPWYVWLPVKSYQKLNDVSLTLGDYEALKQAAIDPYVAVRDAYIQYRQNLVNQRKNRPKPPEVRIDEPVPSSGP
jgi:phospholipid-binding lipoprotein MlaA